jgi:hypothetical protein
LKNKNKKEPKKRKEKKKKERKERKHTGKTPENNAEIDAPLEAQERNLRDVQPLCWFHIQNAPYANEEKRHERHNDAENRQHAHKANTIDIALRSENHRGEYERHTRTQKRTMTMCTRNPIQKLFGKK